jgi:nickel/cobalt transporter (NicO) family protein
MNKNIIIILLFIIFFFPVTHIYTQDNPFFSKTPPEKENNLKAPLYPGFIQALLNSINDIQRDLNNSLSVLSRKINEEKNVFILFLLSGLSLFYGLIHALGPGHGKVIMVSYVLSHPLKARQGIFLGGFIAVIHTTSAVVLVSILYFILKSTYSGYSQEPKRIISLVSYGLIFGMGIFLLLKTVCVDILKLKKDKEQKLHNSTGGESNTIQNLIIPALIIGLVPCEGAVLILIFSISINSYWLGILLAIAMSIGMAFTISIIGITTIYSKKGFLKIIPAKNGITKVIGRIIQLIGAVVILLFGLLLFLSKI